MSKNNAGSGENIGYSLLLAAYGTMKAKPEKVEKKLEKMREMMKDAGKENEFPEMAEAVKEMFGKEKTEGNFYDLLGKIKSRKELERMLEYPMEHGMVSKEEKKDILKRYNDMKSKKKENKKGPVYCGDCGADLVSDYDKKEPCPDCGGINYQDKDPNPDFEKNYYKDPAAGSEPATKKGLRRSKSYTTEAQDKMIEVFVEEGQYKSYEDFIIKAADRELDFTLEKIRKKRKYIEELKKN